MVEEGLFWVGCDELTMECISRGGGGLFTKKKTPCFRGVRGVVCFESLLSFGI